jgi:hypothetical protein
MEISPDTLRLLAISAGNMRDVAEAEGRRILLQAQGNRFNAIRLGIQRLQEIGSVNEKDVKNLNLVIDVISGPVEPEGSESKAFIKVHRVYQEMLADSESSSTALGIVSVVNNTFIQIRQGNQGNEEVLFMKSDDARLVGSFIGGIIGAFLGTVTGLGGGLGAATGSGVGAAIGALIADWLDSLF